METENKNPVGRPVKTGNDFGKLGLDSWEVSKLKDMLRVNDLTLRALLRRLVREWMKENTKR